MFYTFEGFYKRKPESWRDFKYGMAHLERRRVQDEYRMTVAARMAQLDKEPFTDYTNRLRTAAGYTRS